MASFPGGNPYSPSWWVGQPPHMEYLASHKDRVTYQCMEVQAAINVPCAPAHVSLTQFPSCHTLTRSSHEGKVREGHNHCVYTSSFKFQSIFSVSSPGHLIRVWNLALQRVCMDASSGSFLVTCSFRCRIGLCYSTLSLLSGKALLEQW